MKKILVPFDFTDVSRNSAAYAAGLGKFFDAKLVLFHSFQLPVVTAEASFIQYPVDEMYKENLELLKKERSKLQRAGAMDLPIDCVVKAGLPGSNIIDEAIVQHADLIVMGITGRNKLGEVLVGSNAVYTARNSEVPVLIVPEEAKYSKIKKIAFACDFDHTEEGTLLEDIQHLRFIFDAELDVVNIYDETKEPSLEKAITGLSVENNLSHTAHKTFFINSDDPAEGLEEYLDHHKPDLMVIVPRKHNIVEGLFKESMTKHMAFHSHIPLLTMPQIKKHKS
jgi:nucleotide-binding universal stress UspA family protein